MRKRYFAISLVKDKPPIVHLLFVVHAESKTKAIQLVRQEAAEIEGKELAVYTKQVDVHPVHFLTAVKQEDPEVVMSPD